MLKIIYLSGAAIFAISASALSAGTVISNDLNQCAAGKGPSVLVHVKGLKANKGKRLDGKVRVQTYNAVKSEWLKRGKWLHRVESLPKGSAMRFCLPVPKAGVYGVAVRHDVNGNGKTDLTGDGGGFSNNPKLSTFRIITGRAGVSYKSAKFKIGPGVKEITIDMKYR